MVSITSIKKTSLNIVLVVYTSEGEEIHKTKELSITTVEKVIDISLNNYPKNVTLNSQKITIKGNISNEYNVGVDGLIIDVSDVNINNIENFSSTPSLSKNNGKYRINISYSTSEHDLQALYGKIQVSTKSSSILFTSNLIDLKSNSTLDISIPSSKYKGVSELTKIKKHITKENINTDDVNIINKLSIKNSWNPLVINSYILAEKYADDKIPAEIYYALIRSNTIAKKEDVYRLKSGDLSELLSRYKKENIIDDKDYDE